MPEHFATLVVDDPHNTMDSLSKPFPPPASERREYWARTYEAANWRRYKIEPGAYRTLASVGLIGGKGGQAGLICLSAFNDRAAVKFSIESPGLDFYYVSFLQEGSGELRQPGAMGPTRLDGEQAAIYRARSKTELHTGDGTVRLNVMVPVGLVRRHAALLLDGRDAGELDFDTSIDCRSGGAASLRRLSEFFLSELAQPHSLFTNPVSAATAEELLIQSIVLGLSHNRSPEFRRQKASPAPGAIRRAEDFIRNNAGEPITVESVARAAGCSIRALQLGFRRFRHTTPMAALRQARLERARDDIAHSDGSLLIIDVAARYGFGNAGRFSDLYRQAYGENPSETLRARSLDRG